MAIDQQFLEEMSMSLFLCYDSAFAVDAPTYAMSVATAADENWHDDVVVWKAFTAEEKQVWLDRTVEWLEAYQQKYPHHYDKIVAGWKKIDW